MMVKGLLARTHSSVRETVSAGCTGDVLASRSVVLNSSRTRWNLTTAATVWLKVRGKSCRRCRIALLASLRAEVEQLKTDLQKANAAGPCGVDNSNVEITLVTTGAADGGNKLPWNTVVSKGSKRKKAVPSSGVLHHDTETAQSGESHGSDQILQVMLSHEGNLFA